ncbi:MAG: response regulator FixJ [Alphaproteobacteria bacterium]|nr:response regulator FixJ [Alphaproteobacteria bacterium]
MSDRTLIYVVDDDDAVRDSLEALLLAEGFDVQGFGSAEAFLADGDPASADCCLLDVRMPGKDGLTLLQELDRDTATLPIIVMTGHGDVPMAVKAMKLGAVDFIEKPFDTNVMLTTIRSALQSKAANRLRSKVDPAILENLEKLTPREREVLEQLVAGRSNKEVGRQLGISPRTVEIHRSRLMEKMTAGSLAELVRMAIDAGIEPAASTSTPT